MALSACLAAGLTWQAWADDDPRDRKSAVDDQITDARGNLAETSNKLLDAYQALERTRSKVPAARARADRAAQAQTAAQSRYDDAVAAVEVAEADEAKAERELQATTSEIDTAREAVGGLAGEMYQRQGLGNISVVVGAEDPQEVVDRMIFAESVGGTQDDAIATLNTSRADLVAQGDRLTALREATQRARGEATTALDDATSARRDADSARRDLEGLASTQSSQAKTLRQEKARDTARLDGLQAESDRLAEVLAERARKARIREAEIRAAREAEEQRQAEARRRAEAQSSRAKSDGGPSAGGGGAAPADPAPAQPADPNPAPPPSSGVLAAPSDAPVSSEFGLRLHPVYNTWRLHSGRDWAASCGAPIRAAADGEIISALPPGSTGGYGNQIVIDHGVHRGVSLATTYNHLESFARTSGRVSRGDVIGYVGTTGTSTGCHLHFETRENGTPVDPRRWL